MLGIRIKRAREAKGFALRKLGELAGVSQTAIKKYEDGQIVPSSSMLLKLAKILDVKFEYFFRPETISLEGVEYRKRSSLGQKQIKMISHEVIDHFERRLELEGLFPQPPVKKFSVSVPTEPINEYSQIEAVANSIRDIWKLGRNPIPELVDVLENNGIRVFMVDNADLKFDGLAGKAQGMPVIVVGKDWPGDRQRFTLAHELGHLVLENINLGNLNEEKACDHFAGAFLMPDEAVLKEFGNSRKKIELRELMYTKHEYGVSMMCVSYRLRNLGVITPSYHKSLFFMFRAKGWNTKEPGEQYPSEKAHTFEQLVFHAIAEDYVSDRKAAELLQCPLGKLNDLRELKT